MKYSRLICPDEVKNEDAHLPNVMLVRAPIPYTLDACAAQATKLRRTIIDSDAKKEKRRIAHSTPGSRIVKPARKKKIITELE